MVGTHRLACQYEGCTYALNVVAGDLPPVCRWCKKKGFWQIVGIYDWTLQDLRFLQSLRISPD